MHNGRLSVQYTKKKWKTENNFNKHEDKKFSGIIKYGNPAITIK